MKSASRARRSATASPTRSLIEGEFKTLFIDPVVRSSLRTEGLSRYLLGIDWTIVDGMASEHARITMPSLMIWGADDPIFPVAEAAVIERQFPDCRGFTEVPCAKLFVHEEKPDAVARATRTLLLGGDPLAEGSAAS